MRLLFVLILLLVSIASTSSSVGSTDTVVQSSTSSLVQELEQQRAELDRLIALHKRTQKNDNTISSTSSSSTTTTDIVYDNDNDNDNNDDNDDGISSNDYGFIDRRRLAGVNMFGIGSRLEPRAGTVSMIIIIVAVLFVETCFEYLNELVADTAFEGMIKAIEGELMVVGTMAFMFKIVLYTTKLIPPNYIYGLEFADLLVPITSFFLCAQGIVLTLVSVRQCDIWSKANNIDISELLDEFLDTCLLWPHKWHWLPVSRINSEMEFRIYHTIFCETYKIQRKAFAFDEYVQRVFEKYLLDVISIEMIDWLIICCLCLANWARLSLKLQYHNCTALHYGLHDDVGLHRRHRQLGGSSSDSTKTEGLISETSEFADCQAPSEMKLFTIIGALMFLIVLVLALVSRLYELRVLGTKGIRTIDDYAVVLQQNDDFLNEAEKKPDIVFMNEGDLKDAVTKAKKYSEEHHGEVVREEYLSFRKAASAILESMKEGLILLLTGQVFKHMLLAIGVLKPKEKNTIRRVQPLTDSSRQRTKIGDKSDQENPSPKLRTKSKDTLDDDSAEKVMTPRRQSQIQSEEYIKSNMLRLQKNSALKKCILFGRPDMYFDCVESIMMMISFYIALWATNQLTRARKIKSESYMGWQVLTILPGILSFLMYIYVIKVAALLRAIVTIDNDILEKTIEQTEDSRALGEMMKKKLLERLSFIGQGGGLTAEEQLKELFEEIDDNGSNQLSRSEFQVFLNTVGITFSRDRWRQIFREIDKDHNDEISFEELFLFLFPDNDQYRIHELKHLKACRQRVRSKSVRNISQKKVSSTGTTSSGKIIITSSGDAAADTTTDPNKDMALEDIE